MSWNTFKQHYLSINELDFALDYSRIRFPNGFFQANEEKVQSAFSAMDALEAGSIANPDEGRQVGHYWLRNAELAPDAETQKANDKISAQNKLKALGLTDAEIEAL